MRSAGAVYRKLREVKFRHLIVLYRKYLKKSPENCKYNYKYEFAGDDGKNHEIRLCLVHQNGLKWDAEGKNIELFRITPHLIDVCQQTEDCLNCNAFILKYTREDLKKIFENELNNKVIKEKRYPEICALEWVLERSVAGTPPLTWFQEAYYRVKNVLLKNKNL